MEKKLLLATGNAHKVREIKEIFAEQGLAGWEIADLSAYPEYEPPEEDGDSFRANAAIKAAAAARMSGLIALADDSGLAVDYLGGAPGIYSARYAGENATYPEKMAKLLAELKNFDDRRARFVCVIALAYRGDIVETFRGEVTGTIAPEPRGTAGFGYDPIFIPDGYDRTFGELGEEVKSKLSHRARAFALAAEFVHRELQTMDDFEFV